MSRMSSQAGADLSKDGTFDIAAAVAEFHEAFSLPMSDAPTAEIDSCLVKLRVALLEEEVGEFVTGADKGDLVGIADALADIVYVVYGTALTYGIDLDAVLREVHRSNMSKLGPDGKPLIRGDGKVLKSERYFPPDVSAVLHRQAPGWPGRPSERVLNQGVTRPAGTAPCPSLARGAEALPGRAPLLWPFVEMP